MSKYNLWEAAGRPTSYNPIPVGYTAKMDLPINDVFLISFKAKSPTGASLRVQDYALTPAYTAVFNLTNEFKEYSFLVKAYTAANPAVYFFDLNNAGNIVVQDIRVVEKPLGRATINGIDGFRSGKWKLHPNAKVIDDETIEHVKTASPTEASTLLVEVKPNTTYTFSGIGSGGRGFYVDKVNSSGIWIATIVSNSPGVSTFTTDADATHVLITTFLSGTVFGTYTFKRPMLNMGGPAPYEPKRGERMVLPQIGKNLIDITSRVTVSGTSSWNEDFIEEPNGISFYGRVSSGGPQRFLTKDEVNLIKGKTVTISAGFLQNANVNLICKNAADVSIFNDAGLSSANTTPRTYNIPAESAVIYFNLSTRNGNNGDRTIYRNMQIEEGSVATPYETYRVRTTRRATKERIIGKNLFPGWVPGYITVGVWNENPSPPDIGQRTSVWMPCKPSTPYTVSGGDRNVWHFKNASGVITASAAIPNPTTPSDAVLMRVYYSTNGSHQQVQIEEGVLSPTAYEPVRYGLRKATKLPKKNYIKGEKEQDNALFNQGTGTFHLNGNVWENGKLRVESGSSAVHGRGQVIDVIPGTTYTFSCKAENSNARVIIGATDKGAEYVSTYMAYSTPSVSFVATSDKVWIRFLINGASSSVNPAYFWDIQLEPGSAMTSYESYKLASRPAPKGLEFNGINDRLTATAPLATLGNKNFEIEAIFKWNPSNPGNYAQQSILSCGDIRFGVSNVSLGQIGFYTPSSGWVAVTHSELPRDVTRLRAVVTPNNVQIFINNVFIAEKAYTGAINATPQTMLHIGAYASAQYFFSGTLLAFKLVSEGVSIVDFDFTKPQNNIGTSIKGNNGLNATVFGNPYQLNRQARR
jgi:hypothetical protein